MEHNLDDLKELEEKRNDITVKLDKIEERKSHVSHEVYEKVKKEYQEKLANLDKELSTHAELIKDELTRLEESESSDKIEAKDLQLKLEEIELRYTIGEYDEETYSQQKKEVSDKIDLLEDKLGNATKRKKWLQDMIAVKGAEPSPPEEKAAPEEKVAADISIDEHILEQTLPEEAVKLDEIIVEEEAVRPTSEPAVEPEPEIKPEEAVEAEPEQNTVACPKCGHQNAQDSWYCEKCGAEILDTPIQ